MTDGTDLKGMIADEVSNQVGVSDLLGDGSIEDEVDAGEIGAAVGRQFGESLGREIGASIGRNVHEALATELVSDEGENKEEEEDETGEPLRTTVTTAVRDGVSEAFEDSSVREPLESVAESATGETDLLGEEAAEEEAEPDEPEQPAEEAEEPTEADEDEVEGEGEAETEDEPDGAEGGPSADELEDLRRETLEDFLGVMSYEDLQSVAKDVDVKANLSRGEMTEEIIEAVTGEESEGSDADNEETGDDEEEADAAANAE